MTEFAVIDRNLRECFRALSTRRDESETRLINGIEVVSLGVCFQMFNAAFLTSPVENEADLERRILSASVLFGARGKEWSFWLCDSMLPEAVSRKAQRILAKGGLSLATQMPGMIAEDLLEPERRLPDCEVRTLDSENVLNDFRAIGSVSFRVPPAWFCEVFDDLTCQRLPFRGWVGYIDGKAAVTAATIRDGHAVGIYNVATVPECRGRGYAEAVMRRCVELERTRLNPGPIVLQSTAIGLKLYEQMGFRAVTRFRVWVS